MDRKIQKTILLLALLIVVIIIIPKRGIASNNIMLGDINSDNKINTFDLLSILRHTAAETNKNHPDWILTGDRLKAADITGNGKVDASDILCMLRYIAATNNPEKIGKKHPDWLNVGKKENVEVKVTKITLNKPNITLNIGDTEALIAIVSPSNATNKSVIWQSDNTKIVTVDQSGNIKGISKGEANIIVITKDGSYRATAKVTVKEQGIQKISVTGISLNKTKVEIENGKTATITATVKPINASNKNVTWSSSDTSIATVKNGVITAKSNGKVTITATTKDGGKTATCEVTVKTTVTGISLNKTKVEIENGKTATITATVKPTNASNKNVTWSSSDTSIATVKNGVITAKGNGTATITATTKDGGKKATCKVTVITNVTGIKLNKTTLTIEKGSTETLAATVSPSSSTNKTVTWSSSNTSIVTVSSNGVITAKGNGTATITATTKDRGKKATCKVTVITTVTGIKLNKTTLTIEKGSTETLAATVSPSSATNKTVTWSSSNTSIVTVSSKGVVTAKSNGTATITAKTNNGKTATCKITVITSVTSIQLNKTSTSMFLGTTLSLSATVSPSSATNKTVTWSSSNTSIVTVSSTGKVTAKNYGTATVTAKTNNGKTATCKITVKKIDFTWSKGTNSTVNGWASRAIALPNGTVIAGYESHNNTIRTSISSDGGKTWKNEAIVYNGSKGQGANVNLYYDSNILYLAYNVRGRNYYSLEVSYSKDNGKTWHYHSMIEECYISGEGIYEPYLGKINGKLTVMYADARRTTYYQDIVAETWNGSTWTNKRIISDGESHNSWDGMPAWIQLSNGTYALVIESSAHRGNGHPIVVQLLYSTDGIKWSKPKDIYISYREGRKAAAPGIAELPTGQIVVSFQTNEDYTGTITESNKDSDGVNGMKTIYSDGTDVTKLTIKNFSKAEYVLSNHKGVWTGIYYYDGYLYAGVNNVIKRVKIL